MHSKGDIFTAASEGNRFAVERFIAAGEVNARDYEANTPLHYAVTKGQRAITEVLIASGANVNAKNIREETPLHLAAAGGHREIVEVLLRNSADVNAKNNFGMSPLYALLSYCRNQNLGEVASLLIRNGADVNLKSKEGRTPLDIAKLYGYENIVTLLIEHGARE